MAVALRERRPIRNAEAVAERPDGTRVSFLPFPTPLYDSSGSFIGAVNVLVDISERKRTEEALARKAREQTALHHFTDGLYRAKSFDDIYSAALQAILNALETDRAAILLFDATGTMRFEAWRNVSEEYRKAVEGHSPWQATDPNPQPICMSDVEASEELGALKHIILAEGIRAVAFIPLIIEYTVIGKFVVYFDAPHSFTDNEINLAVTIGRQLSFAIARKRGEDMRRHAQREAQLLAAVVNSSDDAILSIDLHGMIMSWNPGAERLYGYSSDEAIGKSVRILIPPNRYDEEYRILGRIRNGETIDHYETIRQRKDGSRVDISLSVSPVTNLSGMIVGASKIARDITDRKQAIEALRASEERYRALFSHAPSAVFVCDQNAVLKEYNGRAVELWGREPEIGVERYCGSLKLWLPDGTALPHEQSPIMEVLRSGVPALNVEVFIERPDGSRLPVVVNFAPLKSADGETTGAITTFVDISDRKRTEEQRELLLREMNHRVKNLFTITSSIVALSARSAQTIDGLEADVRERLAALSRAHTLALQKPKSHTAQAGLRLHSLIAEILSPYDPRLDRIKISGQNFEVNESATTAVALLFNEFATNSVKYGSLSVPHGTVDIACSEQLDKVQISWTERGGPTVTGTIGSEGFGSTLIETTVMRMLDGDFSRAWEPDGLVVHLDVAKNRLAS